MHDKSIFPPVKFPTELKASKKKKRKQIQSEYPRQLYDKFFIGENITKEKALGKILKLSSTPTPISKVPKYIRHESYRAGYFINNIENLLKKIRSNRSKSSLYNGSLAQNNYNLKNLI